MPDNERARIRSIMYEPSSVWLATEYSGRRWLTDQFVLYDVTGAEVLHCYDTSYDVVWPDGPYQLMATGVWRAQTRDSIPEPDIEAYFRNLAGKVSWRPARPTEWSVAEHPGKAMLWISEEVPCLLGESTWTAIKRHHPDVVVEYGHSDSFNVFRFSEVRHDPDCEEGGVHCGHRPVPFCFAAGIRVPEGQEDVAYEIALAAK